MKEGISEKEAIDMLWRRETNQVSSGKVYNRPARPDENTVLVERLEKFRDIDVVFYTKIGANIDPLTPQRLAQLAIDSARSDVGVRGRDGISYLIAAKRNGIQTPLMPEYEEEILREVRATSLNNALRILRGKKH